MIREWFRVAGTAVVATLALFFVASLFGASLRVTTGFGGSEVQDMTWFNVLASTAVAGLLAIALAMFLRRFANGKFIFVGVAVVVFLASMLTLSDLGLSTSDFVWQSLLHAVFAILLVVGFYVSWPEA